MGRWRSKAFITIIYVAIKLAKYKTKLLIEHKVAALTWYKWIIRVVRINQLWEIIQVWQLLSFYWEHVIVCSRRNNYAKKQT